jgi:hypothetical protein
MKVKDFALKFKFNNTDINIVEKLYGEKERMEQEWFDLFKNKINFDRSIKVNKTPSESSAEKAEMEAEEEIKTEKVDLSKAQKIESIKQKVIKKNLKK